MTYILNYYQYSFGQEECIGSFKYNSTPFIPRKDDVIILEEEPYTVRKVALNLSYPDSNSMVFDIMLDYNDVCKEWWE